MIKSKRINLYVCIISPLVCLIVYGLFRLLLIDGVLSWILTGVLLLCCALLAYYKAVTHINPLLKDNFFYLTNIAYQYYLDFVVNEGWKYERYINYMQRKFNPDKRHSHFFKVGRMDKLKYVYHEVLEVGLIKHKNEIEPIFRKYYVDQELTETAYYSFLNIINTPEDKNLEETSAVEIQQKTSEPSLDKEYSFDCKFVDSTQKENVENAIIELRILRNCSNNVNLSITTKEINDFLNCKHKGIEKDLIVNKLNYFVLLMSVLAYKNDREGVAPLITQNWQNVIICKQLLRQQNNSQKYLTRSGIASSLSKVRKSVPGDKDFLSELKYIRPELSEEDWRNILS